MWARRLRLWNSRSSSVSWLPAVSASTKASSVVDGIAVGSVPGAGPARRAPGSSDATIERAGHGAPTSHPDELAAAIRHHLLGL